MFLYVAFQAAHGPITEPPKKYLDLYLDARVSRSHLNRAATVSVSTSETNGLKREVECFLFNLVKMRGSDEGQRPITV